MTIKNSDTPAMPTTIKATDQAKAYGHSDTQYKCLTKREVFAKDAPDVLESFKFRFIKNNYSNKDLVSSFSALSPESARLTTLGEMKLIKEWRYAYADLMLED